MRIRTAMVAMVLLLGACGGKKEGDGGGGGEGSMTWPAKPADGTPVVFEFVEMVTKGDRLEAKMRIFNFESKPITRIDTTLDYLDGTGKKVKDFPWSWSGPSLVGAKEMKEKTMGAFIPPETKRVTATIKAVDFGDGTKWPAK